jgi:hypothetical protein
MPAMEKGYAIGTCLHLFLVHFKLAYDTVKREHPYKISGNLDHRESQKIPGK